MKKSEIRRHKVTRFCPVPLAMMRDGELSDKEVGIYGRILALPEYKDNGEPFDFSVEGYCSYYYGKSTKGCKAVYSGLSRLVEVGWIDRIQEKKGNGQWGKVIYDLLPEKTPLSQKRHAENGDAQKRNTQKGDQNNIDKKISEENISQHRACEESDVRRLLMIDEMANSQIFIENIQMRYHLNETEIKSYIEQFKMHTAGCTNWIDNQDCNRHFRDWLKYAINEKGGQNHETVSNRRKSISTSDKSLESGTDFKSLYADWMD